MHSRSRVVLSFWMMKFMVSNVAESKAIYLFFPAIQLKMELKWKKKLTGSRVASRLRCVWKSIWQFEVLIYVGEVRENRFLESHNLNSILIAVSISTKNSIANLFKCCRNWNLIFYSNALRRRRGDLCSSKNFNDRGWL